MKILLLIGYKAGWYDIIIMNNGLFVFPALSVIR